MIEPPNLGFTLDEAVQNLQACRRRRGARSPDQRRGSDGLARLQSLNVPVIIPATDDTIITSDASGLLFRSRAQEALLGQALANYLIGEFNLTPVATVQLDVASTAGIVGFTTSAATLGVTPQPAITLADTNDMTAAVSRSDATPTPP